MSIRVWVGIKKTLGFVMPPLTLKKYKKWDSDRPTGDELYDDAKPIVGKSLTEELKELKSLSEALNRRPLNRLERRQRSKTK